VCLKITPAFFLLRFESNN